MLEYKDSMKKIIFAVGLSLFMFIQSNTLILAKDNPLNVENNKFGIHITNENDLNEGEQERTCALIIF